MKKLAFLISFISIIAFLCAALIACSSSGDDDDDDSGDDDSGDDDSGDDDDDDSNLPQGWIVMDSGTDFELLDVWGSSSNDVFSVGWAHWEGDDDDDDDDKGKNGDEIEPSIILHFDGKIWSDITPDIDYEHSGYIETVWGSSGNNVFIGGYRLLLHYDGSEYSRMDAAADFPIKEPFQIFKIWGLSGNDVYAVGKYCLNKYTDYRGFIMYYNGDSWSLIELAEEPQYDYVLRGIWGSSSNDIYVSGAYNTYGLGSGELYHYDGSVWSLEIYEDGSHMSFVDLFGTSGSNIYGVADQTIMHYNGAEWSEMDCGTEEDVILLGLWGFSASSVLAVGSIGPDCLYNYPSEYVVLKHDESGWSIWNRGNDNGSGRLESVWGTSPNDMFFVGYQGLILHYGGPDE